MEDATKYFFILSFTAANQSGVAIILAYSDKEAYSILKREGRYNGSPEKYKLVQIENVGRYCGCAHGLMIEHYAQQY